MGALGEMFCGTFCTGVHVCPKEDAAIPKRALSPTRTNPILFML
jgi:hypothetical protein